MASRKSLTNQQKCLIIAAVEKKEKKKKDIAAEFDIAPTTLSSILKNKRKILEADNKNQKKIRSCDFEDVDKAILKWMSSMRNQNLPLSGPLIKEKARQFGEALGHQNFQASTGWLDKFKKRHNVVSKVLCGESSAIDTGVQNTWTNNILPGIIKEYNENDIFNADETGLFFKCLPNKTLTFKGEKCFGGKHSKDRITVLACCNMSGTEKLKLLIVGKSKKPRCFKGIKSLEVSYESNKKSWMTGEIYEKWLIDLDKKFAAQKRNILLFVDNCPAHPKLVENKLKNIKIAYFPPNMTSVLQPLDQGIINNLKVHYRKRILKNILNCTEQNKAFNIDLIQTIRYLNMSWKLDVTQSTIANCFKKAGFSLGDTHQGDFEDEDDIPIAELWSLYMEGSKESDIELSDYINIDRDLITTDNPTDEDIIQSLSCHQNQDQNSDSDDSEDIEIVPKPTPSFADSLQIIDNIRNYVESKEDVPEEIFKSLRSLQNFIEKQKWSSYKKQTTILQYFNKT